MEAASAPTPIPAVWANDASSPYINTIPTASQEGVKAGAASFADGFPPLCFVPFASGGAGPFGSDFNGILNQISGGLQWTQAGNFLPWSSAYSTIIGGYANGAIVQSATTAGLFWRSTTDNNTSDPDTGGANWVGFPAGSLLNIQFFNTAGTFTYTPTAGTTLCDITIQGGFGAGGGAPSTSSGQYAIGAGGGAGGIARSRLAVASATGQTITIGAGGTGVSGSAGNAGGTTSFGSLLSATGGSGGSGGQAEANGTPQVEAGGAGGTGTGGNFHNGLGQQGGLAAGTTDINCVSGPGAPGILSGGAPSVINTTAPGNTTTPTGGGSGAASVNGGGAEPGGAGSHGVCIILEYA